MAKGTYMKDGGMDRDPQAPPMMKTFMRGAGETIKKDAGRQKPMSMGGNGMTFLPGCTPGPKGVVSQHKTMASGYELPATARRLNLSQRETETGDAMSPGLTNRGKR